jgi:hypothetical protein
MEEGKKEAKDKNDEDEDGVLLPPRCGVSRYQGGLYMPGKARSTRGPNANPNCTISGAAILHKKLVHLQKLVRIMAQNTISTLRNLMVRNIRSGPKISYLVSKLYTRRR